MVGVCVLIRQIKKDIRETNMVPWGVVVTCADSPICAGQRLLVKNRDRPLTITQQTFMKFG